MIRFHLEKPQSLIILLKLKLSSTFLNSLNLYYLRKKYMYTFAKQFIFKTVHNYFSTGHTCETRLEVHFFAPDDVYVTRRFYVPGGFLGSHEKTSIFGGNFCCALPLFRYNNLSSFLLKKVLKSGKNFFFENYKKKRFFRQSQRLIEEFFYWSP